MQKKLKPFDLEAALNGAAVVTEEGLAVKEIVLLKTVNKSFYPLVVVLECSVEQYTIDGKFDKEAESELDLFMKPQQVTKWVNIYCSSGFFRTGVSTYNTEEEAKDAIDDFNSEYFNTVQITFEV